MKCDEQTIYWRGTLRETQIYVKEFIKFMQQRKQLKIDWVSHEKRKRRETQK